MILMMKDTKVLKDTKIQSSFSIGHDNIMKYEFDFVAKRRSYL